MGLPEEIKQVFAAHQANISEKNGLVTVEYVVAERKFFLARKKLTYIAKYRIDESKRELRFTEMLKESACGFVGGWESGVSSGFSFKKESYSTWNGAREGTIEEQSSFFGKTYRYRFDFKEIRGTIEKKARDAGFSFHYQITSLGL
ncbi:MAG TPA: hypothetical protein PK114_05625 [Smithellaceae bacterium]|nr:hypothetical protein [Smithellaceae bacterium]